MALVFWKLILAGSVAAVPMGRASVVNYAADDSVSTDTLVFVGPPDAFWGKATATEVRNTATTLATADLVVATATALKGASVLNDKHGDGGVPTATPTPIRTTVPEGPEAVGVAFTHTTPTGFVVVTRTAGTVPAMTSVPHVVYGTGNLAGDGVSRLRLADGAADQATADPYGLQMVIEGLPGWGKRIVIIWAVGWVGLWVISRVRKDGVWSTIDKVVEVLNPFRFFGSGNAEDEASASGARGNSEDPAEHVTPSTPGYRDRGYLHTILNVGHNFNFGGASPGAVTEFIRAVFSRGDPTLASASRAWELLENPHHSSQLESAPQGPAPIPAEHPSQSQSAPAAADANPAEISQAVGDSVQTEASQVPAPRADMTEETAFAGSTTSTNTSLLETIVTDESTTDNAGDEETI